MRFDCYYSFIFYFSIIIIILNSDFNDLFLNLQTKLTYIYIINNNNIYIYDDDIYTYTVYYALKQGRIRHGSYKGPLLMRDENNNKL